MKKIIDKGLYAEGLRQTRTLTVVFTVLLIFALTSSVVSNIKPGMITNIAQNLLYPWFALMVIIAAPVLTFSLFSFLSDRSRSDFYHSLPHKRSTVFFSYLLALITQFAVMLSAAGSFAALFITAAINYFNSSEVLYGSASYVLLLVPCFLAAAMLCCGAALIARSASGTAFNSAVLYAAIMFVPGLFLMIFSSTVRQMLPGAIVGVNTFDTHLNIPVGALTGIFTSSKTPWLSVPSAIYTLSFAVLYIAAAALIFCKKKSETAADPAPSKAIRNVYYVLVFCSVSIFITTYFTKDLTLRSFGRSPSMNFTVYCILYAAALLLFAIYALITTKSWRGLLHALPALGVGIVLNGVLALSLYGGVISELNFTPDPEEVEWVAAVRSEKAYDHSGYGIVTPTDLLLFDGEKYRLTDEAFKEEICRGLSEYMEDYKTGTLNIQGGGYAVNYVIKTKTAKKTRAINLIGIDQAALESALMRSEEFCRDLTTMPEPAGHAAHIYNKNASAELSDASDIFDALREELKTVGAAEFYEWNNRHKSPIEKRDMLCISYKIRHGGTEYNMIICTAEEMLPKTYALAKKKLPEVSADAEEFERRYGEAKSIRLYVDAYDSFASYELTAPGEDADKVYDIIGQLCPGRFKSGSFKYDLWIVIDQNEEWHDISYSFGIEILDGSSLEEKLIQLGFTVIPLSYTE